MFSSAVDEGGRAGAVNTNEPGNIGGVVDVVELDHMVSSGESWGKDTVYGVSCVIGWKRHYG